MLKEQIDSLLDRVQKPARYMGGEMNCVLKDPNSVDIRYAFAFPDVYEVGMSHLGSRISVSYTHLDVYKRPGLDRSTL